MQHYARLAAHVALTFTIGLAGGAVFDLLGFPAPWLTGSVAAVSVAVLGGAKLTMPPIMRQMTFLVLGVSIGSSVNAEILSGITKWPASIAALCVAVIVTITASTAFLSSRPGWNRSTAFFSSLPGALSYVLAMSMQSNANTPLVVLAQMLRVVTLLLVLPLIISSNAPAPASAATAENSGILQELVIFAGGAVVGYLLERGKFPAGMLFGGMLASAALHVSSVVEGRVHPEILIPSQILLGCFMGLRFSGTNPRLLLRALGPSVGAFAIALAISGVSAFLVAWMFALPLNQLLLAYAPGALEVMIILAFVLGLDPAFVAAHHLIRFIGIALLLPLLAKIFLPRDQKKEENG